MKKIIIIEDNDALSSLYADTLRKNGYMVKSESQAERALVNIHKYDPDLVLLDIMLSGKLNGFDVLERLRNNTTLRNVPVIILTNLNTEEEVAKKAGANEYLIKADTDVSEVMETIKTYVGNSDDS